MICLTSACGESLELQANNVSLVSGQLGGAVESAVAAIANPSTFLNSPMAWNTATLQARAAVMANPTLLEDNGCAPEISAGSAKDADNDGIPLSQTLEFDCNDVAVVGQTINASGSLSIDDQDDTDPRSGFTVEMNGLEWDLTFSDQTRRVLTVNMTLQVTVTGSSVTGALDYSLDMTTTDSTSEVKLSLEMDQDIVLVPNDPDRPFAGGSFTVDGEANVMVNDDTGTVTLSSQSLLYDNDGCSNGPGITSGSFSAEDSKGNSIVTTYSSCERSATLNGASI